MANRGASASSKLPTALFFPMNKLLQLCALLVIGGLVGIVQSLPPSSTQPNGRLHPNSGTPALSSNDAAQRQAHVYQAPLAQQDKKPGKATHMRRKLYGRFLHITDLHPDPHYVPGATPSNACHEHIDDVDALKKPRPPPWDNPENPDDGTHLVGIYGAPTTNCDTPQTLVNAAFDWIKANIMNPDDDSMAVDFVIWTGDSARHDNDIQRPRTEAEILSLNTMVAQKMYETFGNKDGWDDDDPSNGFIIPVVPTLGNNDILPHNIFLPGPTKLTKEYLNIWRGFVPEEQAHVFDRGAYFWRDVVPGDDGETHEQLQHAGLAVVSLNTLYFFTSNSAVDGCDLPSEPGYQQMEWLRVQLQLMREKNMKAILIGHVPPARVREVGWKEGGRDDWDAGWGKRSWDETCWRKYVQWTSQYRDVITGNIFGHMNLDHFMLMDTKELERKHKRPDNKGKTKDQPDQPTYHINSADDYLISLREGFARLPRPGHTKKKDKDDKRSQKQRYIDAIGGEYGERFVATWVGPSIVPNYFPTLRLVEYNITGLVDEDGYRRGHRPVEDHEEESAAIERGDLSHDELRKRNDPNSKEKKPKKPKKPKVPQPLPPSPTAPPGPAYSNQPYTLLGYTQLFANLTRINSGRDEDSKADDQEKDPNIDNEFRFEVEYNTRTDKLYKLKDMTVRSCLNLAARLVDARPPNWKKKQGKDGNKGKGGNGGKKTRPKSEGELEPSYRKGREHKGHRHRKGNKERDRLFREFVNRAFVNTVTKAELNDIIGIGMHAIDPIDGGDGDEHRIPSSAGEKNREVKVMDDMGIGLKRPLEFQQGESRVGEKTVEDELEMVYSEMAELRRKGVNQDVLEEEQEGDEDEEDVADDRDDDMIEEDTGNEGPNSGQGEDEDEEEDWDFDEYDDYDDENEEEEEEEEEDDKDDGEL